MITVSVRFNGYLVRWIVYCCQCNRNTISEFIRDLLYEKMRHGHIEFNRIKPHQNQRTTKSHRSEKGYIIFTASRGVFESEPLHLGFQFGCNKN